jgi:hypothetical protein
MIELEQSRIGLAGRGQELVLDLPGLGLYTGAAVIAPRHVAIKVELWRLRDSAILIMTGMGSAFVVAILLSLLLVAAGRFDIDDLVSFPD